MIKHSSDDVSFLSKRGKITFHSFHFWQRVPGFILLCHLCGVLVFSEVWLHLCFTVLSKSVRACVCVIAMSLSCSAAVLASGLFIVTASLAVTANGEARFVLLYSEGLFGVRLCEDLMRSSRRARPSVCIGRSDLRVKVASTETCGLFLNAGQEPRAFSAHNRGHARSTHGAQVRACAHTLGHTHVSNTNTSTVKTPQEWESEQDRQREKETEIERERETLFDSHNSPPTHLQALFTQVCKCSFHFFSSAGEKKKPKNDRTTRARRRRKLGQKWRGRQR